MEGEEVLQLLLQEQKAQRVAQGRLWLLMGVVLGFLEQAWVEPEQGQRLERNGALGRTRALGRMRALGRTQVLGQMKALGRMQVLERTQVLGRKLEQVQALARRPELALV